ncbi:MAG: glycerophosphodiester phosphodiesterase, partial [Gammaproteobacteria bacterium]
MNNKTLVFAHRGANREAAENTRAAFDKALNYPIDGIETDVQLSRDEVPVLWHDRFLDKLGHPDKRIDDFDYAQLEQMDFAGHFSEIQAAEGVLGFREFADSYRGRCSLQVEIKNRDWETAGRRRTKMEKCLEIIGPVRDQEIFISSFDFSSLEYAGR